MGTPLLSAVTTRMPAVSGKVKASVLVLTGADDPLAPPDQVAAFENEMRAAEVGDWQVIAYGNTLHGFTNPAADGSMMRTALYSAPADRRSWASMRGLWTVRAWNLPVIPGQSPEASVPGPRDFLVF
jgi:dienelactone hydrolase